jgi:ATP-independent RNA helicase DbpA
MAASLVAPAEAHRAQAIEHLQQAPLVWHPLSSLKPRSEEPLRPPMSTLCIAAGRKEKLRPGDVLGALTGDAGIAGDKVGKIAVFDYQTFVAIERSAADKALRRLSEGRIKGRSLKVRIL